MSDSNTGSVTLKLTGRKLDPTLPTALLGARRTTNAVTEDPFLPAGYLEAKATFDVSPAARSSLTRTHVPDYVAERDDIMVLELTDGGTLITSVGRLRDSLEVANPKLVGKDVIRLEKLRTECAAGTRGLGDAINGIINKVFVVAAGVNEDFILKDAIGKIGAANKHMLGVSRLGTKLLMQAIEDRFDPHRDGLCQWKDAAVDHDAPRLDLNVEHPADETTRVLAQAIREGKEMLVFVHGTASSTQGSFGDLHIDEPNLWAALRGRFGDRMFGFEHRTLSKSPIENAIELVNAIPQGAHVSFASHSRGGLVVDLLCLADFEGLIPDYRYPFPDAVISFERAGIREELDAAYKEQRTSLHELAALIRERKLVIKRYVRVACPANGTLLASGNFDVFLSSLLTLVGAVPLLLGSRLYSAIKRVALEIARNRTDAHMVPGIEAMLPDSPLAQLLRNAHVQPGIDMAVIAGDIDGGNMLSRLGLMLTDFLLFNKEDNDLVVNTSAMLSGIATEAHARVLFDRGTTVSHFRYFTNAETRMALRGWLTEDKPCDLANFRALPAPGADFEAPADAAARSAKPGTNNGPIVVLLPGIMGSHLHIDIHSRAWLDPANIASGGIDRIKWGEELEARALSELSYGAICKALSETHRVETFPYDWRLPLTKLGERFGEFLDNLLHETNVPIRLLAHGMGGLVVRACRHIRPHVMRLLMEREGARLVMLGTPNHGTHAIVANLLGKGDIVRTLARLDARHSMDDMISMLAAFPGALQMLPRPGFVDTFQGQSDGGLIYNFHAQETWNDLKARVTDFWFGDHRCATLTETALKEASWLWDKDIEERVKNGANDAAVRQAAPALPETWKANSVYVFGMARNTPCGVRPEKSPDGHNRLKLVGTSLGDGVVTWDSGRIGNIGSYYYMPVHHGDMLATREYFRAIAELLNTGVTAVLSGQPPFASTAEPAEPVRYDAGPPPIIDADSLQRSMLGGSLRNRVPARSRRRMVVTVKAMDLRFVTKPIMVGHYEQDPIAGPEALIDRELLGGDLRKRYSLGLYAGIRGSSTVVLRGPAKSDHHQGYLTGAVVAGLGRYETSLSAADLIDAVHTAALRYLLQVVDMLGKEEREVSLATLLLGFNSSANMSVEASVEALVRGVTQANTRFYEVTGLNIRIATLDIVEIYIDTAISAVHALQHLRDRLTAQAAKHDISLTTCGELVQGEGWRHRLISNDFSAYWPRLMVTDATRDTAHADDEDAEPPPARKEPAIADHLRFMYVGARARAEAVVQQRQPNLVESLTRQQITTNVWDKDFGRMLFQLMIPHDFKDAVRQLDRVVLVVDSQTANLPWELMLAEGRVHGEAVSNDDDRPLALQAAVVRQLSTTRYRTQVVQAKNRTALVIGNPSVKGYAAAFPKATEEAGGRRPNPAAADPQSLPGAQEEARAVEASLKKLGYVVEVEISDGERQPQATQVLSALYRQPWRILHIAGHGIFEQLHVDGRHRSGVLLSDGLMITAAEIAAMEVVPDLVFLNCCHSGQIDTGRNHNKLAASVARELIDIGVRCVVAAGWAVDDRLARHFGETFYRELLVRRRTFGSALHAARRATWEENRRDITWGAFQAYGDPGWMAEPATMEESRQVNGTGDYAAREELLNDLARTRVQLSHQRQAASGADTHATKQRVNDLLGKCPPGWKDLPQLHSAFGRTFQELNELERAHAQFVDAIRLEDELDGVPIGDIERLVRIEVMFADRCAAQANEKAPSGLKDGSAPAGSESDMAAEWARANPLWAEAEAWIAAAESRLDGLDALADAPGNPAEALERHPEQAHAQRTTGNRARSGLRADLCKSKANLYAWKLLSGCLGPNHSDAREKMIQLVHSAIASYKIAEGKLGSNHFSPDLALNRLALDALIAEGEPDIEALGLARHCNKTADRELAERSGGWNALVQPKALLVEHLIARNLEIPDEPGDAHLQAIADAFQHVMATTALKPSDMADIVGEVKTLARFYETLDAKPDSARRGTANRLDDLARRLQPEHLSDAERHD